jgi:hypothetical protein
MAALLSAVIVLSKEKAPGSIEAEALVILPICLFSICYFKPLIALLPLEWSVPFIPEWAPFEPTAEL